MLIQFGHNDRRARAINPRQTTMAEYEANLRKYVDEARAAGIRPVLVTPLTRRYFEADGKIHSDLTAHAETMKTVAAEMKVPLIDLQQRQHRLPRRHRREGRQHPRDYKERR